MEASIIATAFNKSEIDIAVKSGIFRAKKTGIKMNAAPTPAMVRTVVNRNVMMPAKSATLVVIIIKKIKN